MIFPKSFPLVHKKPETSATSQYLINTLSINQRVFQTYSSSIHLYVLRNHRHHTVVCMLLVTYHCNDVITDSLALFSLTIIYDWVEGSMRTLAGCSSECLVGRQSGIRSRGTLRYRRHDRSDCLEFKNSLQQFRILQPKNSRYFV